MAINAWKKAIWPGATPNAHKKGEASKDGAGKRSYDDKHGMEYKAKTRKLEVDGAAKVVKTD